jgi:two-component system nitrogen regulation sensor histidine kinase NtrY
MKVDLSHLHTFTSKFLAFFRYYKLSRKLNVALCVTAILSGIATYIVLTNSGSLGEKTQNIVFLVYLDLTLLLLLSVVITKRLVELWVERRRGLTGSKLHVHIVVLFALVSVTPAIFVAVFSALFFNVGVQAWFGEPVRAALTEARVVADAYLKEHQKAIIHDAQAIVISLRPHVPSLIENRKLFDETLSSAADDRGLAEVLVFNGKHNVVARSYLTFALEFEKVSFDHFNKAKAGDVVPITNELGDRVRVLVRLDPITDTYLYLGKAVDKQVLHHLAQTQGAVAEYNRLELQRSGLQITFIAFFSVVALLLLLSAIWVGLTLANLLVRPITRLIKAAEEVSLGNLSIQVEEDPLNNELDNLAIAFNKMTGQLFKQHQDLIEVNLQSDRRRQFTETVLAGVSAGVIGLDQDEKINLPNQRAAELLFLNLEQIQGESLRTIIPEFSILLDTVLMQSSRQINQQITITRKGISHTLQVCVVVEKSIMDDTIKGYIITFDDITGLLQAQRKAAWSDVARKIAHEIKNPLTPIQLAAERLKRRYLKEITSDQQTFQSCIDTIIRQVGHIGNLVAEFSSFARMPEPAMKMENISELCNQTLFLQKQAHPGIDLTFKTNDSSLMFLCDAQQISQVITNLLQNSIDAVTSFYQLDASQSIVKSSAIVQLNLHKAVNEVIIEVEDNGPGFPVEGRERLTEPYYTTRAKGTGLGLAIVSKIVADHSGEMALRESSLGGARVTLSFTRPV